MHSIKNSMVIIFLFMKKSFKKIIIGSRRSPLAKKQAQILKEYFNKILLKDEELSFVSINTSGDLFLKKKLSDIGNKGLFTKEIDDAQLKEEIDISVHSLKDLPTKLPKGLIIGAYLKRGDHRDAFFSIKSSSLATLKKNSIIGTSSLRRECLIKKVRPDLKVKLIRGNVKTRINKVLSGKYDATILAMAGLRRLEISENSYPIEIESFTPSVGQGIIAIVVRKKDTRLINLVKTFSDYKTTIEASCERQFLSNLNGSCELPVGAFAQFNKKTNKINFNYFYANPIKNLFKINKVVFKLDELQSKCLEITNKIKKLI